MTTLKLKIDSGRIDQYQKPIMIEVLVRDAGNPESVTADVRQATRYNDGIWTPITMMGGELEVVNE